MTGNAPQRARFRAEALHAFVRRAMATVGASDGDAAIVADVLVASDLRGIESHGVARLQRFYVDCVLEGLIDPRAEPATLRETATSLAVDANNGLGYPVSVKTMRRTIAKALEAGCAVATVRHSNHFRRVCLAVASSTCNRFLTGMKLTQSSDSAHRPCSGLRLLGRLSLRGASVRLPRRDDSFYHVNVAKM